MLFKSFRALDFVILYNMKGDVIDNFYDIPNEETHAFLIDYHTSIKDNARLREFIINFEKLIQDNMVKITQIVDDFPVQRIRELHLKDFKIKDSFFFFYDQNTEEAKLKKFQMLKEKIITKGNFNFIETKIKDLYIMKS